MRAQVGFRILLHGSVVAEGRLTGGRARRTRPATGAAGLTGAADRAGGTCTAGNRRAGLVRGP
jgi:hypothetical protein